MSKSPYDLAVSMSRKASIGTHHDGIQGFVEVTHTMGVSMVRRAAIIEVRCDREDVEVHLNDGVSLLLVHKHSNESGAEAVRRVLCFLFQETP